MSNRYGLAIRAAEPADADGIADLMRTAGQTVDRQGLANRLGAIHPESGVVLLAVEWGPPTGVIALNWSWTLEAELKVAQITVLLVDPEQRRRGVARLLLKAASQAARTAGCGELRLGSASDMSHLAEFCLETGFAEAGRTFSRPLRKRS